MWSHLMNLSACILGGSVQCYGCLWQGYLSDFANAHYVLCCDEQLHVMWCTTPGHVNSLPPAVLVYSLFGDTRHWANCLKDIMSIYPSKREIIHVFAGKHRFWLQSNESMRDSPVDQWKWHIIRIGVITNWFLIVCVLLYNTCGEWVILEQCILHFF